MASGHNTPLVLAIQFPWVALVRLSLPVLPRPGLLGQHLFPEEPGGSLRSF